MFKYFLLFISGKTLLDCNTFMAFFRTLHDQAVLYCVCVCMLELTRETGRVDILRAVNSGGTVVGKVVNSYVSCFL